MQFSGLANNGRTFIFDLVGFRISSTSVHKFMKKLSCEKDRHHDMALYSQYQHNTNKQNGYDIYNSIALLDGTNISNFSRNNINDTQSTN